MGGNSRFEVAYFHRPWHEFANEETLKAKIGSTETKRSKDAKEIKLAV